MVIDLKSAFEEDPPIMDFIWPGFLAGTVGALVAPGATGKSFWALQAAMSVSCSVDGGDLVGINPTRSGRVIYLAGEDPDQALRCRAHSIGKRLTDEAKQSIAKNLHLEPIMGKRLDVMNSKKLDEIIKLYLGSRLIVLDTLSRIHGLDENSNSDMSQVVAALEYLAHSTGASVLYLHHVSKSSLREGLINQQQAGRGASALIDNVRWCGFMSKVTKDKFKQSPGPHQNQRQKKGRDSEYVQFGVSKQNYGEHQPDRFYARGEGGVLVPTLVSQTKSRCTHKDKSYVAATY